MSEPEKKEDQNLLQKKRERQERDSNEKKVCLCQINGDTELIKEEKTFKSVSDLSEYLSKLENPYTIIKGQIFSLNSSDALNCFFNDINFSKIYQKEDNSEIYNEYYKYNSKFEKSKNDVVKIDYPRALDEILVGDKFFFNLPDKNCPKYYRNEEQYNMEFISFLSSTVNNIFHLYIRKNSGSSFFFMRKMEKQSEHFFYFDFRKLKEIFLLNKKNEKTEFNNQLKQFIFYSLFFSKTVYHNIKEGFERINNYYKRIWTKIYSQFISLTIDINKFIKIIFDSYICLYQDIFVKILEDEDEEKYQTLIFILDHFNNEIDLEYIKQIVKDNNKLRFIIQHSFYNKNEITNFFNYIDNQSFLFNTSKFGNTKGIQVKKEKTVITYYEEMYEFGINNFDDNNLKVLKLYKDDLIDNFGLNNQGYIFRFIHFMNDKDKNLDKKDPILFSKFLKIISNEIEMDIRQFYNSSLEDENYYISKYYNIFLKNKIKDKKTIEQKHINEIKGFIPLNYFIIKFSKDSKDILDITPSCKLVEEIIKRKSKNFSSILYQSEYYSKNNNHGEQGNILQKAIEEKLRNDPSILLNYSESTLLFNIEYIIPSAKNIKIQTTDNVDRYYKATFDKNNNYKKDILSYLSKEEINDMENLEKKILNAHIPYKNVILFFNETYAKSYDLGLIKFINESSFIIVLFQITVSREKSKFLGVNMRFDKDILYIVDKFEHYLKGYKSKGVYLIYVLDKDDNSNINEVPNIDYKSGLENLKDNVFLFYYHRKFLHFITKDNEVIKELTLEGEKIKFEFNSIHNYFLEENIQKIFDKVLEKFSIKIGKIIIDNYDFDDIIGNFLILTKISDKHVTVIININNKKLHSLEINNNKLKQISNDIKFDEKISYIFEITNPDKVNKISLFYEITI